MDLDSRLTARKPLFHTRTFRSAIKNPTLPLLAVVVLALPALWPLLQPGFLVSDDGMIHVYRIAALAGAWQQGVLYPRLFPEFGFGYGQAVLNFYAPLTYWPGAALTIVGIGPSVAAQFTIALGFLLAALAAYGFVRSLWGPLAGVLAAVVYTYFPYHLADAYVRGALPEQFAFMWPPLILWAYTAAFWNFSAPVLSRRGPSAPLLWSALAWAGLIYTHNLSALIFVPVAISYLLLLAAVTGNWRGLVLAAGSFLLAMLLSAPLWLPFFVESRYVGIALGPSAGYEKHLAPLSQVIQRLVVYEYRHGASGTADHALNWVCAGVFLLVLAIGAIRLTQGKRIPAGWALAFGLGLTGVSAFLTTAPSLGLWRAAQPVLAQLQYPWRFLALTGLGMAMVAGALPGLLPKSWRLPVAAAVALVAMVVSVPHLPAQPLSVPDAEAWSPDRMWREDAAAGQVGATWTGEFLPLAVQEQRWALGRSLPQAMDGPALTARPVVRLTGLGYASTGTEITTSAPMPVRLHQFDVPGWTALLDGQSVPTRATGEMGLLTVDVPAGTHDLSFRFGPSPARSAGAVLATLGVLLWAILAWQVARPPARVQKPLPELASATQSGEPMQTGVRLLIPASIGLLALALMLSLNRFGVWEKTWIPRPANASLEDVALLLGYDVAPARSQNAVDVTLYWLALRDVGQDYKAFVHLVDSSGQVIAQHDGDPGGGYTPTSRWRSGEIVPDRHRLALPANLSAGNFGLKAGLYQFEPLRNLKVDPPAVNDRVTLGRIRLPGGEAVP